ncbi:MAG: ribosome biogenesis factor YjgA [Gammaproteobacteria bacterium]
MTDPDDINGPENPDTDNPDTGNEEKSKSQVKREMHALTEMGRTLVELNASALARIDLPDDVRRAVDDARSMASHGARKRQIKYLGKLMRSVDTAAINQSLDALLHEGREAAATEKRITQLRDRLIEEGDAALGAVFERYPEGDRQQLRQLVRGARNEQSKNRPPSSGRALLRLLRQWEADL